MPNAFDNSQQNLVASTCCRQYIYIVPFANACRRFELIVTSEKISVGYIILFEWYQNDQILKVQYIFDQIVCVFNANLGIEDILEIFGK